jgi:hypothetical protein
MKITSTYKAKPLLMLCDLPKKAQSEFDYVNADDYSARFVKYRDAYYDVHDTQRITVHDGSPMGWAMVVPADSPLAKWHAVVSETYFSGVLFRLDSEDNVICGSYSS